MEFLVLTTLALGISALLGVMRIDDGKLRIAKITILSLTILVALAFAFKDDAKLLSDAYKFATDGIITHAPETFIANLLLVLIIPMLVSFSLCLIYYHVREWLDEKGLR